MMVVHQVSKNGRAFIRGHEKTVYTVYLDPVGIKTGGVGHTGPDVNALEVGTELTKAQVEKWYDEDIEEAEAIVNKHVKVELTQDMFDAVCSFAFNTGPGRKGVKDGFVVLKSGKPSTILTKINKSDFIGASQEFPKWVSAKGKKLNGLVKRRAQEKALFLQGLEFDDEKFESNVEADCQRKPKGLHREPAVQATTAVTTAALLNEQATKLEGLAVYSDYLMWAFIALTVLALIYTIRSKKDESDEA
jgi:lysozyme